MKKAHQIIASHLPSASLASVLKAIAYSLARWSQEHYC